MLLIFVPSAPSESESDRSASPPPPPPVRGRSPDVRGRSTDVRDHSSKYKSVRHGVFNEAKCSPGYLYLSLCSIVKSVGIKYFSNAMLLLLVHLLKTGIICFG